LHLRMLTLPFDKGSIFNINFTYTVGRKVIFVIRSQKSQTKP